MIVEEQLRVIQSKRYSTKLFKKNTPIPDSTWEVLEESLLSTPSSYNLQPWKFIVVTDPALKRNLRSFSFNQAQIEDCSHLVVICALEKIKEEWVQKLMDKYRDIRKMNEDSLETYKKNVMNDLVHGPNKDHNLSINTHQCYIALGNLMTSAAILGIDSCPIGGFLTEAYDNVLQIEGSGWKSSVLCALGYHDAEDKYAHLPKVRFEKDDVIEYR